MFVAMWADDFARLYQRYLRELPALVLPDPSGWLEWGEFWIENIRLRAGSLSCQEGLAWLVMRQCFCTSVG